MLCRHVQSSNAYEDGNLHFLHEAFHARHSCMKEPEKAKGIFVAGMAAHGPSVSGVRRQS
jgi:hypothetical protein